MRNTATTRFETAEPQEVLSWAISNFRPRVAITSSFGVESAGLLHMATRVDPRIPVLFLDTGFHFKETLDFVAELTELLDLNLRVLRASADTQSVPGSSTCCEQAKIPLMRASLRGLDCWIAGLRRDQGPSRRDIRVVETCGGTLTKVHPLANWSTERLHTYLLEHRLPFHPLWYQGFTSVGCEPCTSLPDPALGDRSGRWAGTGKTECGIHTLTRSR